MKKEYDWLELCMDKHYDIRILTDVPVDPYEVVSARQITQVRHEKYCDVTLLNFNGLGEGQVYFLTKNGEYLMVPWYMIVWIKPIKTQE